ncbi:adenosine deaminase 2-like [Belonocnema kinseyi]|uniref:adenosine deaminase 2-like n=1 Tax=Belonocnema kinseyi TaxID=2817044 RepID=UPI00143D9D7B|nr:adenosine deaminase 2-like [Belonocnema kinseyi]
MKMLQTKSSLTIIFSLQLITGVPIIFDRGVDDYYWKLRADLLQSEESIAFGGDLHLDENEICANHILMCAKYKEIDEAFYNQREFLPRANFLTVQKKIEQSDVFKIIQKMPKGALLHAHDVATVSQEYVLWNVTYRPDLYVCDIEGKLKLQFFETPDKYCNWNLLSKLRVNASIENEINKRILNQMSMITDDPARAYSDGDKAWEKFQSLFEFLASFMRYKPVFEDYYYQLLKESYDDKIIYAELRTPLPTLYDLNGNKYKGLDVVTIIKDNVERFIEDHPGFHGVKLIYSKNRRVNKQQLNKYLKIYKQIKQAYPSFVAGFDLVGHEDKGPALKTFAEQLLPETQMQGFFHAGETDWYGLETDENLIDAVLLNAKRIGHGYALPKHPKLMEILKERDIAIELNPISNQVLNLVSDLRNHPASILFAENYPIVVSSDDPGLWGAKGLSYDFYEAFMGIMSRNSDLRALKKLALNSLLYSSISDDEMVKAFRIFEKQWQEFLSEMDEKFQP